MSDIEQILKTNNELLTAVLEELKEIKSLSQGSDVKTCTPSQAMVIIGVSNARYLTYFFRMQLLNRRKGGKNFLYYKNECKALADKIASKEVPLPSMKGVYAKS